MPHAKAQIVVIVFHVSKLYNRIDEIKFIAAIGWLVAYCKRFVTIDIMSSITGTSATQTLNNVDFITLPLSYHPLIIE
jgi:hypothetical protein